MGNLRDKMLGDKKPQYVPEELVTISETELTEKVEKAAKKLVKTSNVSIAPIGINLKVPHELDVLLVNVKMSRRGQGIKISKEELVLEAIIEYFK